MFSETIELRGHIIDSLILPKVLDEILRAGGTFKIDQIKIGQQRVDQSFARIEVSGPTHETLDELVLRLRQHGAEVVEKGDVQLASAPADGVFPANFYITTNQQTFVTLDGKEIEVRPAIMDSAIAVDNASQRATAVKFYEVRKGMKIVVGHQGIRVAPIQRSTRRTEVFEFMSNVSIEQPKSAVIRAMARELKRARETGEKILVVTGPTVIHTGGAEYLERLIEWGYVDLLFAGNALAMRDIEDVLFGRPQRINLDRGGLDDAGHENHIRAINAIREAGSIARAVEIGVLQRGIMCSCVRHGVEFVLAGSIRDDGPLPDVITDAIEAQKAMREKITGVTIALMMGTMLHSLAVESLLPANVKTFYIDINPVSVSKLTERNRFQAVGLVTDVEAFLRELTDCLAKLDAAPARDGDKT
ncbi:MAG: TIGR00300 family protein [Verrucomicrobia bacterium]|nr:MAG: TIGR00300 family protein [Verrucomicrobiota bacterium]